MLPSSSARSRKSNAPKTNPGIRRTPPTIDTNLNSYDRTDPFQAFNVLLKLLGSLSSRFGGCQYRLTPQEQKLSMHLLNIVEPFVGSTPSKRTLIMRQPTEVLDAIVFHVDSRVDLLNLAMTCSRMQSVVIPRHFDYRVVKCKVSSISVWHHLSVHRSLAMNVRRLEVLDERVGSGASSQTREMVPGGISSTETDLEDTDDELEMHEKQEQYLLAALSKMTHLESFVWSCNHSPISIDLLWPMLIKCHTLKDVEINDNLVFSPMPDQEDASSPLVARELKTMALKSTRHTYGSPKQPDFTRVKGMLNSCPNLETLNIAYTQTRSSPTHLSADDLFLFGRWPHLISLTLTNLRCSPSTGLTAASTFLFSHPNLEILHLDMTPATPTHKLSFLPNSLPRLREVKAHRDVVNMILTCATSDDKPRPLEVIKGVRLTPEHNANTSFFANLRRFGTNVKRIELSSWNEMEDIRRLVDASPRLTWLDLGRKGFDRPGTSTGKHLPGIQGNVNEWAILLSSAPELTTFHGIKFFYEISLQAAPSSSSFLPSFTTGDRSRIRKNDETASVLAWKCTKLRRVDHWEDGGGKVIVLSREDKDKMAPKWEVRRVKQ